MNSSISDLKEPYSIEGTKPYTEVPQNEQENFVEVFAEEFGNIFEILQGLSLYIGKDISPIMTSHGIALQPIDEDRQKDLTTELHRRGSYFSNFMFAMRAIVNCVAVVTREAALINPLLAILATVLGLVNEMIE